MLGIHPRNVSFNHYETNSITSKETFLANFLELLQNQLSTRQQQKIKQTNKNSKSQETAHGQLPDLPAILTKIQGLC